MIPGFVDISFEWVEMSERPPKKCGYIGGFCSRRSTCLHYALCTFEIYLAVFKWTLTLCWGFGGQTLFDCFLTKACRLLRPYEPHTFSYISLHSIHRFLAWAVAPSAKTIHASCCWHRSQVDSSGDFGSSFPFFSKFYQPHKPSGRVTLEATYYPNLKKSCWIGFGPATRKLNVHSKARNTCFSGKLQVEKHGTGVVVRNAAGQLVWALEGYVVNVADYDPKQLPSLRDFLRNEGLSADWFCWGKNVSF